MQLIAAIDVTNMYQEGGLREGHFLLNGKALSLDLPLQDLASTCGIFEQFVDIIQNHLF
jgi:hypothetical protein